MSDDQKVENSGQAKGGRARAEKLSPQERSEIARKAASARWSGELPQATHGSPDQPLRIGGVEIECFVLEDNTRVLTQASFMEALGRHRKANVRNEGDEEPVPAILQGKALKPFIPNELLEKSRPIRFKTPQNSIASGYRAELLPEVCEVWLKARDAGVLQKQQMHIALQADILIRGLATIGIIALVDEATGFQEDRARDALAEILEKFISDELRRWVKTFPDEYFQELFRLKSVAIGQFAARKPQYVGHWTNNIVYKRLAPGVLEELKRITPKTPKGNRRHKFHQRLSEDAGHPALREHLHAVITLMKACDSWDDFKKLLDRSLPIQPQSASERAQKRIEFRD